MEQLLSVALMLVAIVTIGTVSVVVIVLLAARVRRARHRRIVSPPGRIVAIGSGRIHVIERGPARGPSVVLIGGIGAVASSWGGIIDRLAETHRVVAYDRPGLGWSSPVQGPRSAAVLAAELADLLAAAAVPAPYVLVGHSLGGVIARRLAERQPHSVAGIVLVDSPHEDQYRRIPEVGRILRRMTAIPRPVISLLAAVSSLRRTATDPRLPAAAAEEVRDTLVVGGATHLSTAIAELRAVALADASPRSLGDLPLVVMRHGRYQRMPMLEAKLNERFEALFAELQADLARLSTRGRLVVAEESGHEIQLDQPDLVVDAIQGILAAVDGDRPAVVATPWTLAGASPSDRVAGSPAQAGAAA